MLNILNLPMREIELADPFFDSLRADYVGFDNWYMKKAHQNEMALVSYDERGMLQAFLYTKVEEGSVTDVVPPLNTLRYLKVGTMKVNAHGTKLGEHFLKQIFDRAKKHQVDAIYVTIFPKHAALCGLFMRYGFQYAADKMGEKVYVRLLLNNTGDVLKDFPVVRPRGKKIFILGIKPEYHTRLFAESILNNERADMLEDVSYTNSIHKTYLAFFRSMYPNMFATGDILVIYRTTDEPKRAWFRSVVTSVCVVESMKSRHQFANYGDFVHYCGPYTVFNKRELDYCWGRNDMHAIRMLYNIPLQRRLTRQTLIEEVGIDSRAYAALLEISEAQLQEILRLGEVDESIVIY
ncbi:hypothetical protein [Shewanella algae]|uniref:hypothetical protein n=1 Tax=Shewanella algae TaxID=38313 RepID=UPI001AADD3BA|nr:hypothetical protein [Shewanella algae]MBO2611222.1 hypothetical protein [Shewanella algae]MBO2695533.1 hypothetical protein [Shewanella algae]